MHEQDASVHEHAFIATPVANDLGRYAAGCRNHLVADDEHAVVAPFDVLLDAHAAPELLCADERGFDGLRTRQRGGHAW